MKSRLERPTHGRKDSYLSLVDEFRERGEPLIPFTLKFPADDFPAFLKRLEDCARGSEIAAGFVAHETFWLVDGDGKVLGVANLRHMLTDALRKSGGHIGFGIRPSARRRGHASRILGEALIKAKERGISRVLLTCHKGNIGSARAIIKNGGILESEELLEGDADVLQRFWITLEDPVGD